MRAESLEGLSCYPGRSQMGSHALQCLSDLQELDNIVVGDCCNKGSAAWRNSHESVLNQAVECFADGSAAHAQLLGQMIFGQLYPKGELIGDNSLLEKLVYL